MNSVNYTHQGQRENQEDSFGYIENSMFLVCDGVGGHAKGEVASNFIVDYVKSNISKLGTLNKADVQQLIVDAQIALNELAANTPDTLGMGTTLAGLFRSDNAFFILHLGDSRVYWIKPQKKKIWHTWDHSMVGNLMQMGEISREDGRFHPLGNRINKAIIANNESKTNKPDISKITSVDSGDIFFICSDGVTESWSEYELLDLLCDTSKSIQEKLSTVEKHCVAESKDNNTAIIIEIDGSSALAGEPNEEISWIGLDFFEKDYNAFHNKVEHQDDFIFESSQPEIVGVTHESSPVEIVSETKSDAFDHHPNLGVNSNDSKKKIIMAVVLLLVAVLIFIFVQKLNSSLASNDNELRVLAKQNGLYGYKNEQGEWVIEPRFVSAEPFEEGRAKVTTVDSIYYLDTTGEMIAFISFNEKNGDVNSGEMTNGNQQINLNPLTTIEKPEVVSGANRTESSTENGLVNPASSQASSSPNYYKNEVEVENAWQKMLKSHQVRKISSLEERAFLDKIKSAETKKKYRNKIEEHNKSIFAEPSIPDLPVPVQPEPPIEVVPNDVN